MSERVRRLAVEVERILAEAGREEVLALAGLAGRLQAECILAATSRRSEDRLLSAAEMAQEIGPSWTARKLYRLRPDMPPGCSRRVGGRLYFHSEATRAWAAHEGESSGPPLPLHGR